MMKFRLGKVGLLRNRMSFLQAKSHRMLSRFRKTADGLTEANVKLSMVRNEMEDEIKALQEQVSNIHDTEKKNITVARNILKILGEELDA